jgi:hypothetical protein
MKIEATFINLPAVFPQWRKMWASLGDVEPLLTQADALMARRAKGNTRLPRRRPTQANPTFPLAMEGLRRWADGEPPIDPSTRSDIIQSICAGISPVLTLTRWPRWLYIESAFLDGSTSGDLQFSAVALRALCEEVQWQHAIDLRCSELANLASSSDEFDRNRLIQFIRVARASLDNISQDMVLEGVGWPSLDAIPPGLQRVKSAQLALNDYVHPNYGSHVAALFPERSAAAQIPLEGVISVYETFFQLSWAEKSIERPSKRLAIRRADRWSRTAQYFLEHTLPTMRDTEKRSELKAVLRAPSIIEWLTSNQDDAASLLQSPEIRNLISTVGWISDDSSKFSVTSPLDGARPQDLVTFVAARRCEQLLKEQFPNGSPETTNQSRWLQFLSMALQLAMLLDQVKAAAFKMQTIRQIVAGNHLGILLCLRSLVEHRAVAGWLAKRLGEAWETLGKRARLHAPLPNEKRSTR